jgi:hypothetical protein
MKIIITEEQSKLLRGIVGEQSGDDELDLFMKRRSSLIDELIEYIKDEYGDYIMSRFESDDDDDDDWDGYKDEIDEKWSQKFKKSIKCNNPKGFSQKAYCQGRKKRKLDE